MFISLELGGGKHLSCQASHQDSRLIVMKALVTCKILGVLVDLANLFATFRDV